MKNENICQIVVCIAGLALMGYLPLLIIYGIYFLVVPQNPNKNKHINWE